MFIFIILVLLPVLTVISGVFLYSKNGRREIFKLDIVQFVYAFVLAPVMFIWLKALMFVLLKDELNFKFSLGQIFVVDTIFSLVFLYVFAFIVIHSLTKSLENKRYKDPLLDIFQHSEKIHLWISHTGILLGIMILVVALSFSNIWLPMDVFLSKFNFYMVLIIGIIIGSFGFGGFWMSIFEPKFFHINKLLFAFFFILHVLVYFLFNVSFNSSYVIYWATFAIFTALVSWSYVFEKSTKAMSWWEKLHHKIGWSAKKKKYLLSK